MGRGTLYWRSGAGSGGSSYTLMTFVTSIIIGLCLGTGAFISMAWGAKEEGKIRNGIFLSFLLIGLITLLLMAGLYLCVNPLIRLLQVPEETAGDMKEYLVYVFAGFFVTFLYNYFANILRSIGNSVIPLVFLGVSVVLNIFFDIYLVRDLHMGVRGAAAATVIAQHISGILILLYFLKNYPQHRVRREDMTWNRENIRQIFSLSGFTCLQQSVMTSEFWSYRESSTVSVQR